MTGGPYCSAATMKVIAVVNQFQSVTPFAELEAPHPSTLRESGGPSWLGSCLLQHKVEHKYSIHCRLTLPSPSRHRKTDPSLGHVWPKTLFLSSLARQGNIMTSFKGNLLDGVDFAAESPKGPDKLSTLAHKGGTLTPSPFGKRTI